MASMQVSRAGVSHINLHKLLLDAVGHSVPGPRSSIVQAVEKQKRLQQDAWLDSVVKAVPFAAREQPAAAKVAPAQQVLPPSSFM